MQKLEGTKLGRYQLVRLLGIGGMSAVYLANDEEMQREVAIKVVNMHASEHAERFRREITALSTLHHEHILPVLDCGEEDHWIYMVMPYTQYGSLREILLEGSISLEQAGLYLTQIASALQHAHDNGYIHRDLKPANILLRDEHHAYLADFGLAKLDSEESFITQTGYLMGTPEYMAPELSSQPATASCDIYALGILLYQMVSGRTPYTGSTPFSIYMKHINEQPARPTSINPAIPLNIEEVILCAIEKDPDNRFASAVEMAEFYQSALEITNLITEQQTGEVSNVPSSQLPAYMAARLRQAQERKTISLANLTGLFAKQAIIPVKHTGTVTPVEHIKRYIVICAAIAALMFIPAGIGFGMGNNATNAGSAGAVTALSIMHPTVKAQVETPTATPHPKPTVTPKLRVASGIPTPPQQYTGYSNKNGNGNGNGQGHHHH